MRIHPLTRNEEERYFKAAFNVVDRSGRRNLYDVGEIMINQGCRPEEVMFSRKADLDIEAGTFHVQSKSRAWNRTLYLTPESLESFLLDWPVKGLGYFPANAIQATTSQNSTTVTTGRAARRQSFGARSWRRPDWSPRRIRRTYPSFSMI